MKKIIISTLLFSFLFLLIPISSAHALSCDDRSVKDQIKNADVLFQGRVITITSSYRSFLQDGTIYNDRLLDEGILGFEIQKVWKGNIKESKFTTSAQLTSAGSNYDDIYWELGKDYLIEGSFIDKEYYKPLQDATVIDGNTTYVGIDCDDVVGNIDEKETADLIKTLGKPKKTFETKYSKPVTPPTYSFTQDMFVGSTGENVVKLQEFLIMKNYLVMPAGTVKGYFGALTKEAVIKYQKSVGLSGTGSVDSLTRAKLNQR